MYFNIDDVRNKLKENFSAFVDEYEAEVEASYRKKVLNLAPGEEAPKKGLDQQEAEAFDGRVSEYRHRAEAIIEDAKGQIRNDVTAAPDASAAAYFNMLSKRKYVSPYEIQFAADVFGKNFSCYSLLQEIAEKNDIYIQNHPVTDALRGVQVCEECNRYYTMATLEDPNHTHEVVEQLYFTSVDGTFFGKDLG